MTTATINTETGELLGREAPLTLAAKLARVLGDIDRIPKRGWNDFHMYHFATESDIKDAVRNLLAPYDVSPSFKFELLHLKEWHTPKGKDTLLAVTHATLTFTCGDTGETITTEGLGSGDDPLDKAVMKSVTAAVKYALLNAFLIPTGDDPDAGAVHQQDKVTDDEKKELEARINALTEAHAKQIGDTMRTKKFTLIGLKSEQLRAISGWVAACEKVEADAAAAEQSDMDAQAADAAEAEEAPVASSADDEIQFGEVPDDSTTE